MKKSLGWVVLAVGIVFGLSMNANAAGGSLKIGYFDANGAAMQSQWGKKIVDDLKKEQDRLSVELDTKGKAFKAAKDEFDKKKDVMDEKAKSRKQKELQDMVAELEKESNESSQKFNQDANVARKPLFDKMKEIITRIGKDEKYDFILEKAALHFASEKDDLTSRVVTELDKTTPK